MSRRARKHHQPTPAGSHREQAMRAAVNAAQQLMGVDGASNVVPIQAYTGEHGAGGNAPLRMRSWNPVARDANADTLRTLKTQRAQCRELARTHPIAIGALNTYLDRVIGTGLALVPEPDRRILGWSEEQTAEWKAHVQTEFSLWADSTECDITGAGNFYDRQRVVAGSRLESGDSFTLLPDGERSATMPYKLRLQLLEADRIGNPGNRADTADLAGGIRRDAAGRPIAAHIYHRHPGATYIGAAGDPWAGQWVDFVGTSGRRRLLHHWQPTRPEQTRGVPWFAPIVAILKDLDTYTDAEIKAAVVSAFFTVFIKTDDGDASKVWGANAAAAAPAADLQMAPGAVLGLAKGEEAQFANPNRPNTAFGVFVEQVLAQIGMALSIPVEVLLKRFNASYSASRAAFLDAWMFFRSQRTWLARSFCQPTYETLLAEAVSIGRIAAPGFFADPLMRWAYTRAAWHGDSQGSINPKDEVAAYSAAIERGLMTHERAEWELFGTDWNQTTAQKAAERKRMKADDLLPPPKAGAAAPAPATTDATGATA